MKKIVFCIFLFLAAFMISVGAEAETVYRWNGKSDFADGANYSIRSYETITETLVVPEEMTLYIRGDGKLTISEGAKLVVNGTLKINTGGILRSYGSVEIGTGGNINVYGDFISREDSDISIKGKLNIFSGGYLNSLGNLSSGENSEVINSGKLYVRENGEMSLLGPFKTAKGSSTRIYGDFSSEGKTEIGGDIELKPGGKMSLKTDFTVGEAGNALLYGSVETGAETSIHIDGRLKMKNGSSLPLYGRLETGENGKVIIGGGFSSEVGSTTLINGKAEIEEDADITLNGVFGVGENGRVFGKGNLNIIDFDNWQNYGTVRTSLTKPEVHYEDGVAYVGNVLIVNSSYPLPADYGNGVDPEAQAAYEEMRAASGYNYAIMSGYRSYYYQIKTFNYWASLYGEKHAELVSARAGTSEHQSGLCFDVGSLSQKYAYTPEGQWLEENCWKYGFIIRFPKDCVEHTGYSYEPWHIRYVGVNIARQIHEQGICLEEFLGLA